MSQKQPAQLPPQLRGRSLLAGSRQSTGHHQGCQRRARRSTGQLLEAAVGRSRLAGLRLRRQLQRQAWRSCKPQLWQLLWHQTLAVPRQGSEQRAVRRCIAVLRVLRLRHRLLEVPEIGVTVVCIEQSIERSISTSNSHASYQR